MLSLQKQSEYLQLVSRTFALTIPVLPEPLCDYVSLSYLMCRTCDTIEDDPQLSHEVRVSELENYVKAVRHEIDHVVWTNNMYEQIKNTSVPAEVDLLKDLPSVMLRLYSYPKNVSDRIIKCLDIMSKGMAFQQSHDTVTVQADLDRYCYSVAGVVGELLAELFMNHSPSLSKKRDIFMPLSVSFGEGLQMTNIIKDIWDDASRGVSWLPLGLQNNPNSDEMKKYFSTMSKEKKIELLNEQIKIASGHLWNGVKFMSLVPLRCQGIRKFCAWCVAMAFLSLQKVYQNPLFTDGKQVKISRKQVASVIKWSSLSCLSNVTLNMYFKHIAKGLPSVEIDTIELQKRVSKW